MTTRTAENEEKESGKFWSSLKEFWAVEVQDPTFWDDLFVSRCVRDIIMMER